MKSVYARLVLVALLFASLVPFTSASPPLKTRPQLQTEALVSVWTTPDGSVRNTVSLLTTGDVIYRSSWKDINGVTQTVETPVHEGESFLDAARKHSMAVHALQQVFPPVPPQ